jgi:triacylglycerol lipase
VNSCDAPALNSILGRAGGLAVAMGIGAAVITAYGCGLAQADSEGAGAGSSASSASSSHSSGPKSSAAKSTVKRQTARTPAGLARPAPARQLGETAVVATGYASNSTKPPAPVETPSLLNLAAVTRRAPAKTLAAAASAVDSTFTGEPSIIAQTVTTGLRLLKPIVNLFGANIAGSGASIPFITDGIPPFFVTGGLDVKDSEYDGWKVWTLTPPEPTDEVVIGIHGGSFTLQASLFHWITYANLARTTGATVIVPLYPLANTAGTGGTAVTVIPVMADFIAGQVAAHGAENVSVLGDSAGGTIGMAAAQVLISRCAGDQECLDESLPSRLVLLSPALDLSSTNPYVGLIDDPLLDLVGGSVDRTIWTKGLETPDDPDGTLNPLASPLFGSLAGLPITTVYAGSMDRTAASVLALQQKVADMPGTHFTFELRKGEFHDWMIFPLPDAAAELPGMYDALGL